MRTYRAPEIENEVPSDQELLTYMDEWLKTSSTDLFTAYLEGENALHPEVAEALTYFGHPQAVRSF